jgi:hypothetical protein
MNNISDIVLDAMIKEAVTANFKAKMNAMPSEEELREKYPPSPEHVRKMKKLFAWEKRRDFRKKVMPITKAAAVFLCVATTLLFSALMFSPEVRAAVHGTIVRFFEGFAQVEFVDSETPEVTNRTVDSFSLRFIPDGYELINSEELGDGIFMMFGNSEGNLILFEIQPPGAIYSDTDRRDYREEVYSGITYHVFESLNEETNSNIDWEQDGFMFGLIGTISVTELLEMAFSLE